MTEEDIDNALYFMLMNEAYSTALERVKKLSIYNGSLKKKGETFRKEFLKQFDSKCYQVFDRVANTETLAKETEFMITFFKKLAAMDRNSRKEFMAEFIEKNND